MAGAAAFAALVNPETPVFNQKRPLYSENQNPETPEDSESESVRCGDASDASRVADT